VQTKSWYSSAQPRRRTAASTQTISPDGDPQMVVSANRRQLKQINDETVADNFFILCSTIEMNCDKYCGDEASLRLSALTPHTFIVSLLV